MKEVMLKAKECDHISRAVELSFTFPALSFSRFSNPKTLTEDGCPLRFNPANR